jgi:hypothetical protein
MKYLDSKIYHPVGVVHLPATSYAEYSYRLNSVSVHKFTEKNPVDVLVVNETSTLKHGSNIMYTVRTDFNKLIKLSNPLEGYGTRTNLSREVELSKNPVYTTLMNPIKGYRTLPNFTNGGSATTYSTKDL